MIGLDTHVWQTISLAMMRRNGDELLFLFRKINPVSLPISFSVNWFGCLEEPTTVSRKKKLSAFWRPCSTDFENRSTVDQALQRYQQGRADFSDYLIGATSRQAGCHETASFEGKLRGEKGFCWLE